MEGGVRVSVVDTGRKVSMTGFPSTAHGNRGWGERLVSSQSLHQLRVSGTTVFKEILNTFQASYSMKQN